MSQSSNTIRKPSWFLNLTEGFRAFIELIKCSYFMSKYSYKNVGNQQPVLVVPGFLGSDFSTTLLRRFLRKSGFEVYGWELGRNLGNVEDLKILSQKIKNLYEKHNQKVALIGWSLGGVYVRELAKQEPQFVTQIITLGSPFLALEAENHAAWIFNLVGKSKNLDRNWMAQIPEPALVPTTAFYSKQDGIVPWAACMEVTENETHHNILVESSHLGFCANATVLPIILDVLQK